MSNGKAVTVGVSRRQLMRRGHARAKSRKREISVNDDKARCHARPESNKWNIRVNHGNATYEVTTPTG